MPEINIGFQNSNNSDRMEIPNEYPSLILNPFLPLLEEISPTSKNGVDIEVNEDTYIITYSDSVQLRLISINIQKQGSQYKVGLKQTDIDTSQIVNETFFTINEEGVVLVTDSAIARAVAITQGLLHKLLDYNPKDISSNVIKPSGDCKPAYSNNSDGFTHI